MMAKPIRALELHYPMIQFLIISNIWTKEKEKRKPPKKAEKYLWRRRRIFPER